MASFPGVVSGPYAGSPRRKLSPIPILDVYIFREMVGPFVIGFAMYLLFQFINVFFLAADAVINRHASPVLVFAFLLYRVPAATPLAFVLGGLLGTLLAFGRLMGDGEITALRTSGISFWRIARVPLLIGVAASLLSYGINEALTPKATQLSTRTFTQIIYNTAQLPIDPDIFRKDPTGLRTFYVQHVDPASKIMSNVIIFDHSASTTPFVRAITATTAYIRGATMHLKNVRIIQFKANGLYDGSTYAEEYTSPLPLGENADQFLNTNGADPSSIDTQQLKTQVNALEKTGQGGQGVDNLKFILSQRYALPFGALIAIIAALPLAVLFGKRGRELGMALTLVVMFVYYLSMTAMAALGRNGVVETHLAAWTPNLIVGLAGLGLLIRAER